MEIIFQKYPTERKTQTCQESSSMQRMRKSEMLLELWVFIAT